MWPNQANNQDSMTVRTGRVIHWSAIGFAPFVGVLGLYGSLEDPDWEPVHYFALLFICFSTVMIGRGVRYILSTE